MAEGPQGITAITVGGYKSIRDETIIEIRPLTILAGANSSGKSSIMQPMLMMKQTLDATYDPGPLLINGPHLRFTKFEQLIPRASLTSDHLLIAGFRYFSEIDLGREVLLKNTFSIEENSGTKSFLLSRMSSNYPAKNFEVHTGMSNDQILQQIPEIYVKPAEELRKSRNRYSNISWEVITDRCLLYVGLFETLDLAGNKYRYEYARPPLNPALFLEPSIANAIHIPGIRGNPLRSYPLAYAQGPRYPGHFQDYAASVLLRWKEQGDDGILLVEDNLTTLGLTKWVKPVRIDDASVEIHVGRLPVGANANSREDLVNIADVGIGVSQVLPVIVALIAAKPGQMVYIEQPEMHLHPKAQVALASVLADAAKRGVRVVVETHSSLLLQGVLTLIAQEKLDHEEVMLHWFSRDDEGNTIVDSAEPDRNGAYGDWPEDFGDVELEITGKYLDAVADRELVT